MSMKALLSGLLLVSMAELSFADAQLPADGAASGGKTPALFSLQLTPGIDIPLGESASVFGLGAGLALGMQYRLPFLPLLYVSGGLGYSYDTANGVPRSVSVFSGSLGGGLRFDPMPWLSAGIGLSAGYFGCALSDSSTVGGNPFVSADVNVVFLPGSWHFTLGASYRYLFKFYNGMAATIGISFDLPSGTAGSGLGTRVQERTPAKAEPLKTEPPKEPPAEKSDVGIKDLFLEDIFPVFRTYYDTHPLGKVVLSNTLDRAITDIRVSFQIKEFMDDPKDSRAPARLEPGESKEVDLFGLFRSNILETTEATKAQAKINFEYKLDGKVQQQSLVQTIRILDRNATTWTDDRRAAAFVTTKDPAVLFFSKNVNAMVKGKIQGTVNLNLLTAIAFHQALHLFGLTYSQDPIPTSTTTGIVADYIQFPRQTLDYRGGKCSDFSVLYSALLESVGIETAFITTPGHIFMAFSLGLSPEEARKAFSRPDDLIFDSNRGWIPIEVTESAGFLQAWQDGAKEWRENRRSDQAHFYPLHEAWQVYEPVGLPGSGTTVSLPPTERIVEDYQKEIAKFVNQEVTLKADAIQNSMQGARDQRKPQNDLGVLYAKYGLYDRAKQEFEKLLAQEEYVPALVNLGNIYYLNQQKERALEYYKRAYTSAPDDPKALLAFARVNHDLENYYEVKKVYADLKVKDPALALQFAYLDLKGEEATRQAEIGGVVGVVLWEE